MIHNGIEYGMMQALAEGFNIMKAKKEFGLNLDEIAEIWRYGSVVRSWLLDLTAIALKDDPTLSDIAPWVADSGEGRWTVAEAIDQDRRSPDPRDHHPEFCGERIFEILSGGQLQSRDDRGKLLCRLGILLEILLISVGNRPVLVLIQIVHCGRRISL